MECLRALAAGMTVKDYAIQKNLSVKTVEAHRMSLLRKTGAGTTLRLVLAALRLGIVTMNDIPVFAHRMTRPLAKSDAKEA